MNVIFIKAKSFLVRLFAKSKKLVNFPQEEEHDLFIGV